MPAVEAPVVELTVSEVLFDMDGTLIDSIAEVVRAWTVWAELEQVADAGLHHGFHGRTARELVAGLVPPERVESAFARIVELEERPGDGVRVLPGSAELLAALPRDRWTIVTSATRGVAEARLRAVRLPVPAGMVTASEVQRGKPDPEPYLRGSRRSAGDLPGIVFEDAVAGLISGRAAGNITVAIAGTTPLEVLHEHADHVIESLADVEYLGLDADGALRLRLHPLA